MKRPSRSYFVTHALHRLTSHAPNDSFGEFVQVEQLIHRGAQLDVFAALAVEALLRLAVFFFDPALVRGTLLEGLGKRLNMDAQFPGNVVGDGALNIRQQFADARQGQLLVDRGRMPP